MNKRTCRFCASPLGFTFCDLGMSPLSNAYVKPAEAHCSELFYPLHAFVCETCFLVQLEQFEPPERIFGDYAYFSSYSDSWLAHCQEYAQSMRNSLKLGSNSLVVEVASNDGYLLQFFKQAGIPVLGIEPARNVATAAEAKGIPTLSEFFGTTLASRLVRDGRQADLLVANNVMAHVPDLNDFCAGLRQALKPQGVLTIEFPHLLRLIEECQFDTIYHEHFSYFSFATACRVLAHHGLIVHDVEQLPTHGGSLRVHAGLATAARTVHSRVTSLLADEHRAGLDQLETYGSFAERVKKTKRDLLTFLIGAKNQGKQVVGYGAPAKGNTLLNYCGIRSDLLEYTVDRSPHKQALLLPGTHIPIFAPEKIMATRPAYVLILPWNLREEICSQMAGIRQWGGKFVVPVPTVAIL